MVKTAHLDSPWWCPNTGAGRFDLHSHGDHGTCYVAPTPWGAVVETLLRDVPAAATRGDTVLAPSELAAWRLVRLRTPAHTRLADTDPGADHDLWGTFGLDDTLASSDSYERSQQWAQAWARGGARRGAVPAPARDRPSWLRAVRTRGRPRGLADRRDRRGRHRPDPAAPGNLAGGAAGRAPALLRAAHHSRWPPARMTPLVRRVRDRARYAARVQTRVLPERAAAQLDARTRGLRRAEYDRLVQLGVFAGERVELLYGRVVEMSPQDAPHAGTLDLLDELLTAALLGRARVRTQLPFIAVDESEPEPDLAVVPVADYRRRHPDTAFLLVEVSSSSLPIDRDVKSVLYAASGVPEYWIVDVDRSRLLVHRGLRDGVYRQVTEHGPDQTPTVEAFPDVEVRLADIIG